MKKIIFDCFLIMMIILFGNMYMVNAQVVTYERTEENLGVKDTVKVSEKNKKSILKTPKVDAREKVYDFAGLFSNMEIEKIKSSIDKYIKKFDIDMAIVTIDKNDKSEAKVYADDFYEYNDFGLGADRRGILFLIDMGTREIYITTAGKAIDKYNDSKIEDMLNVAYNHITSQKYYDAVIAFIKETSSKHIPWILIGIFPILLATVPTVIFVYKSKMVKNKAEANEYIDKDSIKITEAKDIFITTNTIRTIIDSSSNGGSTTHSGGGGMSFGGRGKSF